MMEGFFQANDNNIVIHYSPPASLIAEMVGVIINKTCGQSQQAGFYDTYQCMLFLVVVVVLSLKI